MPLVRYSGTSTITAGQTEAAAVALPDVEGDLKLARVSSSGLTGLNTVNFRIKDEDGVIHYNAESLAKNIVRVLMPADSVSDPDWDAGDKIPIVSNLRFDSSSDRKSYTVDVSIASTEAGDKTFPWEIWIAEK